MRSQIVDRIPIPMHEINPPYPASPGVDGDSTVPQSATIRVLTTIQRQGQQDAQQIELDALTRQLMRFVCVKKRLRMPSDDAITVLTWQCWQGLALMAAALCESDVLGKAMAETIRDIADEHCQDDCFGHEAKIARQAIERFVDLLRAAGGGR